MKETRQLVMTIEELKQDKKQLETNIADLLKEFENRHGVDILHKPEIRRWNGSNESWGRIIGFELSVTIH